MKVSPPGSQTKNATNPAATVTRFALLTAAAGVGVQFLPSDVAVTLAADQHSTLLDLVAAAVTPHRVTAAKEFALWPLLPAAGAIGTPAAMAAAIGRGRHRQVERVTEALAAAMHATSTQAAALDVRIRRSLLGRPTAITIEHPPAIDTTDSKTAQAMEAAVTRVIGGHWQSHPESLRDRITLLRLSDNAVTQREELDGPVERVTSLFRTSLGPDATVHRAQLDADGELQEFRVDYRPRLAVAVPAFRARLDNHLSQLLPGRWVGDWSLQDDTVQFRRRPELDRSVPFPLDEVLAAAKTAQAHFMLEVCQTVNGDIARWNLNGKVPHALVAGETGGGKTFAETVIAIAALLRGFRVRIADPKRIEFLQLQRWPGVVEVATTREDIASLIERIFALMEERYGQIERRELRREDLVPEIVILDEWYVLRQRLNALWRAGGEDGKPRRGEHPALGLVAELLALARAARIHILLGIQRPDARNFPDGARDNARFRLSLGRLSPEGATMMWDSPYIGVDVPDDIAGRGTVRTPDGPMECQVYWLPNLDLYVPDSELPEADAAFRRRLLEEVTAAQRAAAGNATPPLPASTANTPAPAEPSCPAPSSVAVAVRDEEYEVIGSVPAAAVSPGEWILVDDPEVDGRQVPAVVEIVEDGDDGDSIVIDWVTVTGAAGQVELDRGEYVELVAAPET